MNLLRGFLNQFRRNRKVYIFFICFVIAAMFWFLLALTKDYSSTFEVSVTYDNLPPHLVVTNELPKKLLLNVTTSGYRLLTMGSSSDENTLSVDVFSLTGIETGAKSIASGMLAQNFIAQLGTDVEITSISPDSILFDMSPSTNIRLPVKANLDVSFERQYDSVAPVKISPDTVLVTIPHSQIGRILWIETERVSAKQLRSSLKRNVKLVTPQGLTLSINEVTLDLEVEKFTEGTVSVPVNLINIPKELQVKIFPDRVTAKYLVALSMYEKVKPDMFSIIADASESSSTGGDKLEVKVISSPAFVRSVTWQPMKVDFILKK